MTAIGVIGGIIVRSVIVAPLAPLALRTVTQQTKLCTNDSPTRNENKGTPVIATPHPRKLVTPKIRLGEVRVLRETVEVI